MQNNIINKLLTCTMVVLLLISPAWCANIMSCEAAVQTNKPFILYLHSNGCYTCKEFTPIFYQLMNSLPDYNLVDINYSYPQKPNICSSAESRTIPAVYVVNPQKRTRKKINFNVYFKPNELKSSIIQLLNE